MVVGRTSRARDVSTSGNRVDTFSAVILGGLVIVSVALIVAVQVVRVECDQKETSGKKNRAWKIILVSRRANPYWD